MPFLINLSLSLFEFPLIGTTMGEESRKRNTDCVYFLASPLTCKKGFDCEYRHSEVARLNPRDCFYWLAGNCLNATCGFRHPPMDSLVGTALESSQCSVPLNKTNVPCYFYFNGFCSKGDTCSFLHGNDIRPVPARSTKTGFPSINTFSSENKTAAANKKGSAPMDTPIHPKNVTGAASVMKSQRKEGVQQSFVESVAHQSVHAQIEVSDCDEVAEPVSQLPSGGSHDSRSHEYSVGGQSFEEPVMDCIEHENRRESSPGFDVLVDYESESVDHYDDPEYLLPSDLEQRELDSELCRNNFEDLIAHEPMHSDVEILDERAMHAYDDLESEHILFNDRNFVRYSRDKVFDSISSQKRELSLPNLDVEEWNHVDLRNHLQRHRISGNHSVIGLSRRRNNLSSLTSRSFARPRKHGFYRPSHGKRLASQVGEVSIRSLSENLTFSNSTSQCESFRHSRQYKPWNHYDGYRPASRQFPFSDMSRKSVSRDRRSNLKPASFKGPKTLSQIKEEKKKEGNGDFLMHKGHSFQSAFASSVDFKGPKPLSDILKNKRKLEFMEEIKT